LHVGLSTTLINLQVGPFFSSCHFCSFLKA
jgi:hypothetical protein